MNKTAEENLLFDNVAAKAISGICTFLALFITGHQVDINSLDIFERTMSQRILAV